METILSVTRKEREKEKEEWEELRKQEEQRKKEKEVEGVKGQQEIQTLERDGEIEKNRKVPMLSLSILSPTIPRSFSPSFSSSPAVTPPSTPRSNVLRRSRTNSASVSAIIAESMHSFGLSPSAAHTHTPTPTPSTSPCPPPSLHLLGKGGMSGMGGMGALQTSRTEFEMKTLEDLQFLNRFVGGLQQAEDRYFVMLLDMEEARREDFEAWKGLNEMIGAMIIKEELRMAEEYLEKGE